MCLGPEVAIALALSGAGQYINARETNAGLKSAQRAKEESLRTELKRQEGYQAEAGQTFADTLDTFKKPQQEQSFADLVMEREKALTGNVGDASKDFAPMRADAPNVVKTEIANQIASGINKSKEQAKRLAKLGARDDVFLDNNIMLNRGKGKIAQVGNFSGNSANINTYEQKAAYNNNLKQPSGFGDLLGLAGMGMGMYGNMGGTIFPTEMARPSAGFMGPMPAGPSIF